MQLQRISAVAAPSAAAIAGTSIVFEGPAGGFSRGQIAWATLASLAAAAILLIHAGLEIDIWTWGSAACLVGTAAILAVARGHLKPPARYARFARDCATYYAIFAGISLVGAVTSYPIAALTHGYADAALARIDAAFGFDWLAWYKTVAAHPILQVCGGACYESIYLTPAILLGWFAFKGQRLEAHRFLASFWLAAVLTLALFALMPAVGPLSYLWHRPIAYMPISEVWQMDLLPNLRDHAIREIDLGKLRGLVSAPSFHAAAGVLYIRAAWRARVLRWPLVGLAGAMLLATPVEGTHYLADMIIGAAVALAAMAIADRLLAGQSADLTPSPATAA
jgi:hypothetical protein